MVHALPTLIGQRIVAIALGSEDVNDHEELHHDPVLALLSDRLTPAQGVCAARPASEALERIADQLAERA